MFKNSCTRTANSHKNMKLMEKKVKILTEKKLSERNKMKHKINWLLEKMLICKTENGENKLIWKSN